MNRLQPFPEPTDRMLQTFIDLARLARGGDAAAPILTSGEIIPRIWDLTTIVDHRLHADTRRWLTNVVEWLNTQHAWYSAELTPACWPEHPGLTRELSTLAATRYQAGEATNPIQLEEWHRYALPGYLERTRDQRAACQEKHQPWPGRAAHTRGAEEPP